MRKTNEFHEYEFRGAFMTLFIDIEWILSDMLSMLLVGENELQMDLMEFITPNFMLDKKISLLHQLLKSRNNEIYIKYKEDLIELRELVHLRNNFAHKKIELDNVNRKLHFLQVRNKRNDKTINYSFDDLNNKWRSLTMTLQRLKQLFDDLSK